METARLVLDYVEALRWPLLVAALAVAFRSSLRGLAHRMTEIAGPGVRATFEKAAEQAERMTRASEGAGPFTPGARDAALRDAHVFVPRTYAEARDVAESYRDGGQIFLDLSEVSSADAKRFVDFAAGMVYDARGWIERISSRTFLIVPPPGRSARESEGG